MCTIDTSIARITTRPGPVMRLYPRAALAIAAIGVLAGPALLRAAPALRWGPAGHRIVATIAQDRVAPTTLAEARRLLGGQNLADVASWADEIRRDQPATGPWHYVDIETIDSSYVAARDCKEGACIVAALNTQAAILADRTRSDADRAIALKWVIHLVGDLHQPLHAGERGDRGGNDVKITFQGRPTNLHALWDSGLLTSFQESEADVVRNLEDAIARQNPTVTLGESSVAQWAMESHDVARDVVYRNLPPSNDITPEYAAIARPVVYQRLLLAGLRLAAMLDRALGH